MGYPLDSTSQDKPFFQLSSYQYFPTNSPAEPEPPERKGRGFLGWVGFLVALPPRLIAAILVLFYLPFGVGLMCELVRNAEKRQVDLTLVALRGVNHVRPVRPLLPLGYRPGVQEKFIHIQPEREAHHYALEFATLLSYKQFTRSCDTTRTQDGKYKHHLRFTDGTSRTITSTTPHMTLEPEEIARAQAGLARLFPDPQQRAQFLHWGKNLFLVEWFYHRGLKNVPRDVIPEPVDGTEDERAWLVWHVIGGDQPDTEEELFRLPELFASAFPEEADRKAALDWARCCYGRMAEDYAGFQEFVRLSEENRKRYGRKLTGTLDIQEAMYAELDCALPPESEWTHLWLLYRYAGLSERSRAAARDHWLGLFPARSEQELLAWGQRLIEERRADDEPLPPVEETLPLLCVVQRLTWTDGHGLRCRQCVEEVTRFGKNRTNALEFGLLTSYPNDEVFYVAVADDPLGMYPFGSASSLSQQAARVVVHGFFPLLASLGVATVLQWIVAPLLLRGSAREMWYAHREGRGRERAWMWLVSVLIFGTLGAVLAPHGLPAAIGLQIESFWQVLLASLMATAVGGVLIGTCRRIFAVLLTLLRIDVERTWLDEVFGILAGAGVLFFFGNSLLAIAIFALADLLPGLIYARLHRGDEASLLVAA